MKYLIGLLALFVGLFCQAQTEVITKSLRIEKGEKDTVYVVETVTRVFHNRTKIYEEVWRPFSNQDEYKAYLTQQEEALSAKSVELEEEKQSTLERLRQVKEKKGEKKNGNSGGGRTTKPPKQ